MDFATQKGTTAYDLSGKDNHGTVYGAAWTKGLIAGALGFDGVDDYVRIPDSPSLRVTGDTTWELWIYRTAYRYHRTMMIKHYSYEFEMILDFPGNGDIQYYHGDGAYEGIIFDLADIPLNAWTLITLVRTESPKEVKLYRDGEFVQVKSYVKTIVPGTSPVIIGSRFGTAYFFEGLIASARIYNRALTEREIRAHYWYAKTPIKVQV